MLITFETPSKTYALTNRHVCGDPGETLLSRLTGKKVPIGVSSPKQLTRLPFQQVYADWPGKNVYVNLDVGLIDINDLNLWTAKVQGIGEVGEIADLSINNISLRLIGCPVRAFGCSSGEIKGEIHGLFYRYKSVGGFEYVADFLIGQRTPKMVKGKREEAVPFATHPGDSGTLYLIDMQPEKGKPLPLPKPLAVQWGGHVFSDATGVPARSFALATCLSTICNLLEVDLIRDWNLDQVEYWGAVGHYSIAANVANAISGDHPNLKQLMTNNREIISYKDDTLLHSEFERQTTAPFVPMADVPDNVWKHGKQGYSRPHEGPNHFADMDQPSTQFHGTLLKYCEDPSNIDPQKWDAFYDSILDPGTGKRISYEHRGLLPFRVRQIFEEMIRFVHQKKFDEFVCAAGVLTHYVGDACQPLHISYLHHGDPEDSIIKGKKKVPRAEAVHETYEAAMVNGNREAILKGLAKAPKVKPSELLQTPQEAAEATVDLMRRTFKAIPPPKIVAAQLAGRDGHSSVPKAFWAKFGKQTIKVMQDGTHLLAVLWESAWALGNGEQNVTKLGALTEKRASGIYQREDFLPSFYISEI